MSTSNPIAPNRNSYYGWQPDLPDRRDLVHAITTAKALPKEVDLRAKCSPVYDQGELGSCTANAIAGALEFDQLKQGQPQFVPSRLQIYYGERVIEGTVNEDSGAQIRDGIKVVAKTGACDEKLWPYSIRRFKSKPTKAAVEAAKKHLALKYMRVTQTLIGMKTVLANGLPFVFGFTVYKSFESAEVAKTGIVPMPEKDEESIGGHAVMAVGYNAAGNLIVRNSWGTEWGQAGYFEIPFAYVMNDNLADDFWTIETVQ